MSDKELTLEELSERTGVEPRTLRSWISSGLLSPPFKAGRGARYPAFNAERALAIKTLKEVHGLSFQEIERRILLATDEQIKDWALEAASTTVRKQSARDYIRQIQNNKPVRDDFHESVDFFDAGEKQKFLIQRFEKNPNRSIGRLRRMQDRQDELTSLENLILQLENVLGDPAPRRSRGHTWVRISVTPNLELSVRGDLDPQERVLFEQLADQLRAILNRRTKE